MLRKVYSSPLHYTGGKRWLFEHLYDVLPSVKEIVSPFFGGGSIELNFAAHGVKITGYDTNLALVNFWHHWLLDAPRLEAEAKAVMLEHLDNQESLVNMKALESRVDCLPDFRDTELLFYRAVYYYMFNRLSCRGLTFISKHIRPYRYEESTDALHYTGIIHTRKVFPPMNRMRLCDYGYLNITIDNQDFEKTLTETDTFAYCDPPYWKLESLYAAQGFDHKKLAGILRNRKNWVLSYNDDPMIYELYEGFHKHVVKMTSGWKKNKQRIKKKELLIFSHDVYETMQHPQPQQLTIGDLL